MSSQPHSSARRRFLGTVAAASPALVLTTPGTLSAMEASTPSVNPRLFSFAGGKAGAWTVLSMKSMTGESLGTVDRIDIVPGEAKAADFTWILRGVTSHLRYTTKTESKALITKQVALGRPAATHSALIPIRKNAKWWALTQDERRAIFEEQSQHTTVGMKYLPAIARRLHHCRDLSENAPFDFITLFDFAKTDANAFDDMLAAMRDSEEWKYIDREVDLRLERSA